MQKGLKTVVWGVLFAGIVGLAYAQFAKTEDAIEYRQSAMILMGTHFSRIGAMVTGKQPFNAQAVEKDAKLVDTFATLPWEAFMMPGSDKGDTHMKPVALKEKKNFESLANRLEMETAKLAKVSAGGEMSAIRGQFAEVAKTCKACHSKYRSH